MEACDFFSVVSAECYKSILFSEKTKCNTKIIEIACSQDIFVALLQSDF